MTDMCADCPKRATCKELCPEAEAYANQDQVRGDYTEGGGSPFPTLMSPGAIEELDARTPISSVWEQTSPKDSITARKITDLQQKIKAYLKSFKFTGRTDAEVAKDFIGMSRREISRWISEMRELEKTAKLKGIPLRSFLRPDFLADMPETDRGTIEEIFEEASRLADARTYPHDTE